MAVFNLRPLTFAQKSSAVIIKTGCVKVFDVLKNNIPLKFVLTSTVFFTEAVENINIKWCTGIFK